MERTRTLEDRDPARWLRELESDTGALARLVEESGGLALAALRVARARCGTPTDQALSSVAREIAERIGYFDIIPSRAKILRELRRTVH
jgi:hypothetical protein